MKNSKLEKNLNKTWKKLLEANVHHDEHQATQLLKETHFQVISAISKLCCK